MSKIIVMAENIRKELKTLGISNRDVSIKCCPGYEVKVINKTVKISNDILLNIVEKEYYKEDHFWLIVWVNAYCLPMEKSL
jgi:hypothetical protein